VNKGNRPGKVRSVAVDELETTDEPPVWWLAAHGLRFPHPV